MKLQYTFTRNFFLWGFAPKPLLRAHFPLDTSVQGDIPLELYRGEIPPTLPYVEGCIVFQGVKYSWCINMVENKDL
jgi:hypothetical protein